MNPSYLDFEQPIAELQAKIDELRNVGSDNALNLEEEIQRLQTKMRQKIANIFNDRLVAGRWGRKIKDHIANFPLLQDCFQLQKVDKPSDCARALGLL